MCRKDVRYRVTQGAVLLLLTAPAQHAFAQDVGDIDAGGRIARTWCTSCHIVGADQSRGTSTGAPTFRQIAGQTTSTPMALRVFLQTPHDRMPDLHLSREEIDDLIAYILSMREPTRR